MATIAPTELPWGTAKVLQTCAVDTSNQPGHYAAQTLIFELFVIAERKLNQIANEPIVSDALFGVYL
jgi:hypothetical protein